MGDPRISASLGVLLGAVLFLAFSAPGGSTPAGDAVVVRGLSAKDLAASGITLTALDETFSPKIGRDQAIGIALDSRSWQIRDASTAVLDLQLAMMEDTDQVPPVRRAVWMVAFSPDSLIPVSFGPVSAEEMGLQVLYSYVAIDTEGGDVLAGDIVSRPTKPYTVPQPSGN